MLKVKCVCSSLSKAQNSELHFSGWTQFLQVSENGAVLEISASLFCVCTGNLCFWLVRLVRRHLLCATVVCATVPPEETADKWQKNKTVLV